MAILTQSATQSELLLKQLLIQCGVDFEEQYRVYERAGDTMPKYVLDFLVRYQDKILVVECDGHGYHSSYMDIERDILRDAWLKKHGYDPVFRYTSYQIKYEGATVIAQIKNALGIAKYPREKLVFKGKRTDRTQPVQNVQGQFHDVKLYYAYCQSVSTVYVCYCFNDETTKIHSPVRKAVIDNVPGRDGSATALCAALADLKRTTNLTVFCDVSWLAAYCNQDAELKFTSPALEKCLDTLKKHNYLFKYLDYTREVEFHNEHLTERKIMRRLHSYALQLSTPAHQYDVSHTEYAKLTQ